MKKLFKNVKDLKECYGIANLPEVEKVSDIPEELHPVIIAFYKEHVIAKAANTLRDPKVIPDWRNHKIKKFFSWLYVLPAGGVDYYFTSYYTANAGAGDAARLAFLHPDDSKHAVEIASDVFEDFLTK